MSVHTTADINEVRPKAVVERPEVEPVTLAIVPWDDPVFALRGHDPRDHYVERFWLPILGPSSTSMQHCGREDAGCSPLRPTLA